MDRAVGDWLCGWLILLRGPASLSALFNELIEVCSGYPVVLFADLYNLKLAVCDPLAHGAYAHFHDACYILGSE